MTASQKVISIKPHPDAVLESITPAKAQTFLKSMIGNRPISEQKKWEYAYAIDEGRWLLNGSTIVMNNKNQMIDGQHRCLAGILAEKPFLSYVVRGIDDPEAFATIDTGKGRSHADIFGIAGWQNNKTASGAALLIMLLQQKRLSIGGITGRMMRKDSPLATKMRLRPNTNLVSREELIDFASGIAENLNSAVRFANASKASRVIPGATIAALYYLMRDIASNAADDFFRDLGEGVGLQKSDPVLVLRERLLQSKGSKDRRRLTRWAQIAFAIKAWNARRADESMYSLRMNYGEKFPVVK